MSVAQAAIAILTVGIYSGLLPGRVATSPRTSPGYVAIAAGRCCASGVSWSPRGDALAVGVGPTLRIFDRSGREAGISLHLAHSITSVAWAPNGQDIAVAMGKPSIGLYSSAGKMVATLHGHRGNIDEVAWSPDGRILASASTNGSIQLWQSDHQLLTTLFNTSTTVRAVAWSPSGKAIAIAGPSNIRLERVDGRLMADCSDSIGANAIAWSPDGSTIASGSSDGRVRLWNTAGRLLATLKGGLSGVTSVVWSPDSKLLASAGYDKAIHLWDAHGRLLATLTGQTGAITNLAWSRGATLASTSMDGTIRLWRVGQ